MRRILLGLMGAVVGTALVAGGSAVFNQLYEQDVDALMARTRLRPLPDGRLTPWRELAAVPAPPGVKDGAAAITSDGRVAAFGTRAGGIVFVDLRTGTQTVGPAGHVGDVQNDATSPDGRRANPAGSRRDSARRTPAAPA